MASPSAESALPPPPSAEEQLRQLQEKTAAWKGAVAAQLSDAAKKNKVLRDELQKAREERDADLGKLRVQMNQEFKERTAMKEDEVRRLHEKLDELYAHQQKVAAGHAEDLERVAQRAREASTLEAAQEKQKAVDAVSEQVSHMQGQLERASADLAHEKQTVASLTTRLERLGNQYQELSSLLNRRSGGRAATETAASATEAGGQSPLSPVGSRTSAAGADDSAQGLSSRHDAEHQRQLDEVKAAMQERERAVQRELDAARREHQLEVDNLVRELHRRDDHTVMLQTLQKQLQQDLLNTQLRLTSAQEEKAAVEQRLAGKVAALSRELADRLEAQTHAQREYEALLIQDRAREARIEELESEATSREDAFRALMLSEEDKQLVGDLQRQLEAARTEADTYKTQLDAMAASRERGSESVHGRNVMGRDDTSSPFQKSDHALSCGDDDFNNAPPEELSRALQLKAAQLEEQEETLRHERQVLDEQRHVQSVMEARLEAMKRSLAAQAKDMFRAPHHTANEEDGSDSTATQEGWGAHNDSEGAASASVKVTQRGTTSNNSSGWYASGSGPTRRAPLSFDANAAAAGSSARRGWAGSVGAAGGGLLARIPSRLRLVIPVFLFLFVFFSILNMRAGYTVAKQSAHMSN